jgi:hypothetical protein
LGDSLGRDDLRHLDLDPLRPRPLANRAVRHRLPAVVEHHPREPLAAQDPANRSPAPRLAVPRHDPGVAQRPLDGAQPASLVDEHREDRLDDASLARLDHHVSRVRRIRDETERRRGRRDGEAVHGLLLLSSRRPFLDLRALVLADGGGDVEEQLAFGAGLDVHRRELDAHAGLLEFF